MSGDLLAVDVAYALPAEQVILPLRVEPGTTLRQAVERSGILSRHPEIDLGKNRLGVFGCLREPDEPVSDGDRIEIYRPLIMDPKDRRRRRAGRAGRVR